MNLNKTAGIIAHAMAFDTRNIHQIDTLVYPSSDRPCEVEGAAQGTTMEKNGVTTNLRRHVFFFFPFGPRLAQQTQWDRLGQA